MPTDFQIGLLGVPALILLVVMRIPIAAAMLIVGVVGSTLIAGNTRFIDNQLKTIAYGTFTNYSLSIVPLFLLMSEFASRGGLSRALFRAAEAWMGHLRGGLAMATIGASAGFGAICGSSLATVSTMGRVALPELRRAGYPDGLATGTVAAGGTLGILIPPSLVLVVYAILAEQNIEKLFTAALGPAALTVVGYLVLISFIARRDPESGQPPARRSRAERLKTLRETWPVFAIFLLVIGGIYAGLFSPTAAAAVGVLATGAVAWSAGNLGRQELFAAMLATAETTGMIFLIILGAAVFNGFLALALVPQSLAGWILSAEVSPMLVLGGMLLLYVFLGMVMDSLAMIILTVPVFVPIVLTLDFDLSAAEVGIWFGILVLVAAEIGLITPPIGLNLFVVQAIAKDASISRTFRGVLPFVAVDMIRLLVLAALPGISLWLVRLLHG